MIKKFIFRLTAILIGCIFILAVLEIGLRVFYPQRTGPVQFGYDPELGCIQVPYQQGKRTNPDYSFRNNSWGLRGAREYNKEKKTDVRILILGDSFVYGLGVNDEETFASLLEENLSRDGRTVEVINAGMMGKGTDYAVRFLQLRGHQLDIDLIVLCFNRTDLGDNNKGHYYQFNSDGSVSVKTQANSICDKKSILTNSSLYNWLIGWSHLVCFLRSSASIAITKIARKFEKDNYSAAIITQSADHNPDETYDKKSTAKFIELFKKEAKKLGVEFLIFYLAEWHEVDFFRKKGHLRRYENDFLGIIRDQGMTYISTTPVLANTGLTLRDIYNIKFRDYHFTARGNRVIADFMLDYLEKKLKFD